MNEAVAALRQLGTPTVAEVDAFLAERDFPLVDAQGVTFVYRGTAESVALRCWIDGLPATQPLERLGESDLWMLRVELPEGSRIEYKLALVRDGREEWIVDPLNRLTASDPFGANSVCRGFGYRRPDWTFPDVLSRPGMIDELLIDSRAFGARRRVLLYVPARFRRSRRYPLLIVHDGEDYLRYAALQTVLDNLIQRLEIPPLLVALTQSPDRLREYGADERHADFVANEVPAELLRRWPLQDGAAARGLLGASFGAVASLHAAWRHPGAFGRLVLQSGSFAFSDLGHHRRSAAFDPVARFVNEFRRRPGRVADRIHLSCGIYESLIYENRSLAPLLRDSGIELRYEEVRDGHNWENWRDRLQGALTWLFPGPLWMVYE